MLASTWYSSHPFHAKLCNDEVCDIYHHTNTWFSRVTFGKVTFPSTDVIVQIHCSLTTILSHVMIVQSPGFKVNFIPLLSESVKT